MRVSGGIGPPRYTFRMTDRHAPKARRRTILTALVLGMSTISALTAQGVPVLPTLATPTEPAQVRHSLEQIVRDMSAAVRAADIDGYLAHVDLREPVFAQEHRMWAADLVRNTPLVFDMQILDENFQVGDGSVECDVRFTWAMPIVKNEAHVKATPEQLKTPGKDRSLTLRCRFNLVDSAALPRWLFAGEVWKRAEGPGILALYPGDELAENAAAVVQIMPEVRAHVERGFGLENTPLSEHVQVVKLYDRMQHLQFSIYPSYDDPIGGWNEPGESMKILVNRSPRRKELRPLLAHEYAHVATFFLGEKAGVMPWWVLEGVAELSAEAFQGSKSIDLIVRGWAESNQLRTWDQLADFRGEAQEHQGHVYTQGHHMMGYISERFGRDRRNRWLRELALGSSLDEASVEVFAASWQSIDSAWRESLTRPPADSEPASPATQPPAHPAGEPATGAGLPK